MATHTPQRKTYAILNIEPYSLTLQVFFKLESVNYLISPLLFVEVGSMAVSDGVRGDLVTVGVEVLHLRVVGPLVRDVKSCLEKKEENQVTTGGLI